MSQLRAPAARPDRREGGRHGRPGTRTPTAKASPANGRAAPEPPAPAPPDAGIRPQLVRAAVVPTVITTLSGLLAVLVTVRSGGMAPTAEIWAAVVGTVLIGVLATTAAAVGADRVARSVHDRSNALRRSSARAQADLRGVVEQLRRGEGPPPRRPHPAKPPVGDELDLLAQELGRSQEHAIAAVVQASRLSSSVGNEQKVEVFVNLARRLQSLVHREIQLLDELENKVEDPDLLKGLFQVDHLATRIRRHAENLAVLGGAISRRQWSRPVTLTEVLRSAVAEVEQYPRVKLVPPVNGTLRGHAVADVVHLLAELVENATLFSAPHTQVLLRAQQVTAGLAIEVEDRGLGMPADERKRMNALLADPDQVNVAHLLQDGRIGLFVVSALARRHGIAVRLHANIYGGIQAVLVLPQALLGADGDTDGSGQAGGRAPGAPLAGPAPAPVPEAAPAPAPAPPPPPVPVQVYEAGPGSESPASPATETRPRPSHRRTPGRRPLPVRGERATPDPSAATPAGPAARPRPPEQVPPPRPEESFLPEDPFRPKDPFLPEGPFQPSPPPEFLPVTDGPSVPGAVRGTMDRPQLPRRRSQEHLVPQLRDAPAPPGDEQALHDPGLMAAFQRGIGLAEAQPARDLGPGPAPAPATEPPDPRRADRDTPPKE